MARPLRVERAGAWYHVTARGNERGAIFSDDRDRGHLFELLGKTSKRYRWRIHAWVFMRNHYHLLLETTEANLARSMQWLNTSYSVWYNRRHSRSGHLFEGRYKSIAVEPESWGLRLSAYLHLNPVRVRTLGLDKSARARQRAGLDDAPSREEVQKRIQILRHYRWSSYRAYLGLEPQPWWLQMQNILPQLGHGKPSERRQAYQQYVEQQVREGLPESPWRQLIGHTVLGSQRFLRALLPSIHRAPRDCTGRRSLAARPAWPQIVKAVEAQKQQPWESFRDLYGDWGRDLALYLGREEGGLTLAALGALVGGLDFRTVGWAISRFTTKLRRDKHLAKLCENVRSKLQNPEL